MINYECLLGLCENFALSHGLDTYGNEQTLHLLASILSVPSGPLMDARIERLKLDSGARFENVAVSLRFELFEVLAKETIWNNYPRSEEFDLVPLQQAVYDTVQLSAEPSMSLFRDFTIRLLNYGSWRRPDSADEFRMALDHMIYGRFSHGYGYEVDLFLTLMGVKNQSKTIEIYNETKKVFSAILEKQKQIDQIMCSDSNLSGYSNYKDFQTSLTVCLAGLVPTLTLSSIDMISMAEFTHQSNVFIVTAKLTDSAPGDTNRVIKHVLSEMTEALYKKSDWTGRLAYGEISIEVTASFKQSNWNPRRGGGPVRYWHLGSLITL